MLYQIAHAITYTYSNPVLLQPHVVRLRPRSDHHQILRTFELSVKPEPIGHSQVIDLDGNATTKLWFQPTEAVQALKVEAISQVETHCTNPFNYLLEPWAMQLPIDYPASLLSQLHPYLQSSWLPAGFDPIAIELAQEVCQAVANQSDTFLTELNQRIHQTCQQVVRETGSPLPPGITWKQQSGSCRDLAVLFMEVCRAAGLAARFVSGYQEPDPDNNNQHLHAWTEVYLPGAGWRGFDHTQGLAVSDRHIAVVASMFPSDTAPLPGAIQGREVQSEMSYQLTVKPIQSSLSNV
jgi:transglutaminase-like putative cysteine protease